MSQLRYFKHHEIALLVTCSYTARLSGLAVNARIPSDCFHSSGVRMSGLFPRAVPTRPWSSQCVVLLRCWWCTAI
jgi:hypothetical protein